MSALDVSVVDVAADRFAAAPTVTVRLRLSQAGAVAVHAAVLRAQVRIEVQRRRYLRTEGARLGDLFGEPGRWGDSLRPLQWAEVAVAVGAFTTEHDVDLPIPCTADLEVAAARYLHALAGGSVPLLLLFSGTVFRVVDGRLVVEPVPWRTEVRVDLPVACWRAAMDAHFPGGGWLRLSDATLQALSAAKQQMGLPSYEQVVAQLLTGSGAGREADRPSAAVVPS